MEHTTHHEKVEFTPGMQGWSFNGKTLSEIFYVNQIEKSI